MTPSSRQHRGAFAASLSAALLTGILGVAVPVSPARAAANLYVDFSPEPATAVIGSTVVLTLAVVDGSDTPVAGAGARVYFLSGPNAPAGHGNSPDFTCSTDADGLCSISYDADAVGTDTLCAVVTGAPWQCDEPSTVRSSKRRPRQRAAWDGSANRGVSSGGSGCSDGSRTSRAPAANITSTLFSAAKASRSRSAGDSR